MTRSRRARASSSTSFRAALALALLVGSAGLARAARAGGDAPDTLRLRQAELEVALAREPRIYLVLDPEARRLTVKSRGLALQTVAIRELSLLAFQPLFGGEDPPPLEAPAVWTVTQGPGDTDRETIAPTTLKPYSEEEEMAEPAPAGGAPGATPTPKPGERERPASYRVALDNGWQLFLVDEPPSLGWLARFRSAVHDGWQRLKGVEPAHPPLVTLVLEPDDVRGLHHLFRSGTEILVLAGS